MNVYYGVRTKENIESENLKAFLKTLFPIFKTLLIEKCSWLLFEKINSSKKSNARWDREHSENGPLKYKPAVFKLSGRVWSALSVCAGGWKTTTQSPGLCCFQGNRDCNLLISHSTGLPGGGGVREALQRLPQMQSLERKKAIVIHS